MTVLHHSDEHVTVWHGDCIEVLRQLPDCSIDAVITDPPYGIRFMGQAWDGADISERQRRGQATSPMPQGVGGPNGGYRSAAAEAGRYDLRANAEFQAWCEAWATECLRVLRPGGHLAAFGSTRTYHRLTAGIEDAGFEIRDTLAWMFGSGFPKSLDVAKAITGAQTGAGSNSGALRRLAMGDDYEPSGVRGNRDGVTRRSDTGMADRDIELTPDAQEWTGWGTALKPGYEPIVLARKPLAGTVAGNVLAHGTGALNIDACRIGTGDDSEGPRGVDATSARIDTATDLTPAPGPRGGSPAGRWPANVVLDELAARVVDQASGDRPAGGNLTGSEPSRPFQDVYGDMDGRRVWESYADSGGASRFFYTAKAGRDERPVVDGVAHPTVKPLDLMRWLIRLITPPGGTVLDPFAGSGTTAEAAVIEGFRCTTIEREATYLPLIVHRLTKPTGIQQVLA
jgi:site-specific DNA-methyltransferase (adenine-specific)